MGSDAWYNKWPKICSDGQKFGYPFLWDTTLETLDGKVYLYLHTSYGWLPLHI